jgi:Protein of unknown function (DUF2695)
MPLIKKRQLEVWAQLNGEERERFIESLPATREQIEDLFDYLDVRLKDESCIHNLRFTMQFLMERRLDMPKVMSWLNENGGYCDCEVLQNIEPNWFRAFDEAS